MEKLAQEVWGGKDSNLYPVFIPLANTNKLHFIGIGGIGMSGIARILLHQGYQISGSDVTEGEVARQLAREGATIYLGHSADNLDSSITQVVVSSAIAPDNVEVVEAQKRGLPIIHRGTMLAYLLNSKKGIAVSGAHGKTTTTAMISLVLDKNRLDPVVLVGGQMKEFNGNAKMGSGDYLVAEADESDGSFLKLTPFCAVVTNVENDHLDFYKSIDNIKKAFAQFLDQVKPEGFSVICGDDLLLKSLIKRNSKHYITYGFNWDVDLRVEDVEYKGLEIWGKVVYHQRKMLGRLALGVPGQHNLLNALAAIGVGLELGLSFKEITDVLYEFKGVGRRFEIVGKEKGVLVVDDYAHHPTEIKATLKAARQLENKRIIVVFQPHRYTRTHLLKEEFGDAFVDADRVIISDIYSAGEKPISGVTAQILVEEIKKRGRQPVEYLPNRQEIVDYLVKEVTSGDIVLTLGAGHIWQVSRDLVEKLQ